MKVDDIRLLSDRLDLIINETSPASRQGGLLVSARNGRLELPDLDLDLDFDFDSDFNLDLDFWSRLVPALWDYQLQRRHDGPSGARSETIDYPRGSLDHPDGRLDNPGGRVDYPGGTVRCAIRDVDTWRCGLAGSPTCHVCYTCPKQETLLP